MPLAEQSIISPTPVDTREPLRRRTVVWAVLGAVFLIMVGVLAPELMRKDPGSKETKAVPTAAPRGQADQIEGEFRQARTRAAQAALNVPPAAAASAPVVVGATPGPGMPQRPVVPESARRDDNSGALYGKKLEGVGVHGDDSGAYASSIEADAQARQSASVKSDFGDGSSVGSAQRPPAADIGMRAVPAAVGEGASAAAAADRPSAERIAAMAEAARRGDAAATGAGADRSWLKEFGAERANAPLRPYAASNQYTLLQGKVLPAVLGRDLNTDLPGEVTACTTMDVYDSIRSQAVLVPKGSCLMGRYSNAVQMGQSRILFAFSRLILPNGVSVDLPGAPGADLGGAAGIAGDVNNHFFKMFSTSLLVALLAERVERSKQTPSVSTGGGTGAVSAAGQVLVDVSKSVLERNRTIPPTITVPKGTRINVEVTRDIEFKTPYGR